MNTDFDVFQVDDSPTNLESDLNTYCDSSDSDEDELGILHDLLQSNDIDQLFHKRLVCTHCHKNLSYSDKQCSTCTSLKLIATVFDANQSLIFTRVLDRILPDIEVYQAKFAVALFS
ncbi:unnamed protein product [Rotaria sp. Silwood1]|nr:unnamed protein product [Rotaria sp. Silwood1]